MQREQKVAEEDDHCFKYLEELEEMEEQRLGLRFVTEDETDLGLEFLDQMEGNEDFDPWYGSKSLRLLAEEEGEDEDEDDEEKGERSDDEDDYDYYYEEGAAAVAHMLRRDKDDEEEYKEYKEY